MKKVWIAVTIVVILSFIGVGVWSIINNKKISDLSLTKTNEELPVPTDNQPTPANTTEAPLEEPINVWETYTNDELGISFKYPGIWKDFSLTKDTTLTEYYGGTTFLSTKFPVANIEKGISISINIVSKDYKEYFMGPRLLYKSFDMSKSESDLKSILNETIIKKLSDTSLLVGRYGDVGDCSPMLQLSVFRPLSTQYPNFEVKIHPNFYYDPSLVQYEKDAEESITEVIGETGIRYLRYSDKYDVCNPEEIYLEIAKKVYNGTYSENLNNYIETARIIADSLEITK